MISYLIIWLSTVIIALSILYYDIRYQRISGIMKIVWVLTVLYSGFLGLGVYYYSGRNQIKNDSDFRRGLRSTSHCYSGCGLGEITGLVISSLIGLSLIYTAILTFSLAYVFGYSFNILPLMKDGENFVIALKDSFYTETLSIGVMEITAISVDLFISGGISILTPLFWIGLIISLSVGFVAAYPVNLILIKIGVKEGMSSPNS
jgi:hypothetical protein